MERRRSEDRDWAEASEAGPVLHFLIPNSHSFSLLLRHRSTPPVRHGHGAVQYSRPHKGTKNSASFLEEVRVRIDGLPRIPTAHDPDLAKGLHRLFENRLLNGHNHMDHPKVSGLKPEDRAETRIRECECDDGTRAPTGTSAKACVAVSMPNPGPMACSIG